ncbi:MAG: hypothetical protein ACE5FT_07295 [Candidatus Nanoarchaeia archaeon]
MVKCWICGRSPRKVLEALWATLGLKRAVTEQQVAWFTKKFGSFMAYPDDETEVEVVCCPVCGNIIREQAFDEIDTGFDELWEGFAAKKRFVLEVDETSE